MLYLYRCVTAFIFGFIKIYNNNNKCERTEDVKTIADCCLYINPFPTKKIKYRIGTYQQNDSCKLAEDIAGTLYIIIIIIIRITHYIHIILFDTKASSIVRLFSHGIRVLELLDGQKVQKKKLSSNVRYR